MTDVCDKRVERAVYAYADEVYDGDWQAVTLAELKGIFAIIRSGSEGS